MPVKKIYDELNEKGFFGDIKYSAFLKWVRRNKPVVEAEIQSDFQEIIVDKSEDDITGELLVISQNEEVNILLDSREMFYGFDMNNDPDVVTNPVPQLHEISKEYIFNIFKNDTSLNNEKIVYILLYEVSASGNNKFKDIWHFMLMQNGENIQQYYDRLQDVTNSHGKYSFGITNATASISDIAFTCGCDMYKIIRRTI